MSLFTLSDAELAWGEAPLLDHAAMSLEAGERVGLIGRNGTGKSSLLKVIARRDKLDDGELILQDGMRSVYVEQEPQLPEAPTFRDSLIARRSRQSLRRRKKARGLGARPEFETGSAAFGRTHESSRY